MAHRRLSEVLCLLILFIMIPCVPSHAAIPGRINFQAQLTDASGVPLDGSYRMRFFLYDDLALGVRLWSSGERVLAVNDGILDVVLGEQTAFTGAEFGGSRPVFLQIDIYDTGTAAWESLTPRQQLTAVPFALQAGNAADADTLDGLDASELDQSDHVSDQSNPHRVTAAQVGAITTESDPTVPIELKDGVEWKDVSNRPSGLDDGDDVGIDEEIDPTVLPSVKDGIAWNEVTNRPAGLDDGDDVGLIVETDPQVGANTTDYVPRWNGAELIAGSLYDSGSRVAIGTSSPASAGLSVESPALTYGIHVGNPGGGSLSYGLYADALNDSGSAYALFGGAQSTAANAYGLHLDTDAAGSGDAYGIYAFSDTAGSGTSYGAHLISTTASGLSYGLYCKSEVSSPSATAHAIGLSSEAVQHGTGTATDASGLMAAGYHLGAQGNAYGLRASSTGSDTGDAIGIRSQANKNADDTGGSAYGGYFTADNDRAGGASYGLYSRATGQNGNRYGLYTDISTPGTDSYNNYGVYSHVVSVGGHTFGLFSNVESHTDGVAYGAYVDAQKMTTADQDLFGLHVNAEHLGSSGNVYGIYAACEGSASTDQYAGYFYKPGGGDYAGYFYGNVHVHGTLTATSKSFVQPHKDDPTREIVYVALESREHAVVIRGNATLENGEATIEMPEDWVQVAADDGITVNLTPKGAWAPLYVKSESKHAIVVAVAPGGADDVTFSYCIMAPRDGFQDHAPIQANRHFTGDGARMIPSNRPIVPTEE